MARKKATSQIVTDAAQKATEIEIDRTTVWIPNESNAFQKVAVTGAVMKIEGPDQVIRDLFDALMALRFNKHPGSKQHATG